MNPRNSYIDSIAREELATIPKYQLKQLRKQARRAVLQSVQRRAITGEPSCLVRVK